MEIHRHGKLIRNVGTFVKICCYIYSIPVNCIDEELDFTALNFHSE